MELNDALSLVNPQVRALSAYHLEPAPAQIKLNQNENPYDWPEEVKREIAEFCFERPWNRYPPFIPGDLRAALGAYAGVGADAVIVGNGSNEMLLVLLMALMDRTKPVVLCQPTFTVYDLLVRALGGSTAPVMLTRDDLRFDVAAIRAACRANPGSLAILCSPNNPTGGSLSEADLRAILADHTGMLILDQAYVEFGAFNAVSLLSQYPNLVITRTFSKAFSGAGLRLGYMLGTASVIAEVNKVKLPYNINFFTHRVALALLANAAWSAGKVRELIELRDGLVAAIKRLPFDRVWDTDANFVLARTGRKDALMKALAERGILIRDVSKYPMLEGCVRINVGTPSENQALLAALNDFFGA